MAGLKTVIFTNGVVMSTYDDGTPADMFTGKLPVLKQIFDSIQNKDSFPREFRLNNVKFYIANNPLCEHHLEVSESYLKHILQFIKFDKLEQIPIEKQEDLNLNKIIEEASKVKEDIPENKEFDSETKIEDCKVKLNNNKLY